MIIKFDVITLNTWHTNDLKLTFEKTTTIERRRKNTDMSLEYANQIRMHANSLQFISVSSGALRREKNS